MRRPHLSLVALLLLLCMPGALAAQEEREAPADEAAEASAEEAGPAELADGRLPDASVTPHSLGFADRELRFTATAGAVTLTNAEHKPEADIGYVAYVLDSDTPAERPVTFAVNGGPGAASAYLHLGVLGPWRLPMGEDAISPSMPVDLVANAETWLDFTDLVFVDPVGTGFSRLVEPTDRLRERYLSVDGDIEALAAFIARWTLENGRLRSSKYLIGESYGGFRGPLVAEALQREHGLALAGLTLLSPVLDFGWRGPGGASPLPLVSLLPSLAAAAMETAEGEVDWEALAEVEAYAAGDFVVDLLAGLDDRAARERLVARVAALTGLDPGLVERHAGRLDAGAFARELLRAERRIASLYDTGISADDPAPETPFARRPDPVLDGMTPPLTTAMLAHYQDTLDWLPDRRYMLLNSGVNRAWRWGSGRSQPEAVSALRRMLAQDPAFGVLVVHGATDLVTPYFESTLVLRQIRGFEPAERLRQATYPGGHMFYTRQASRRAFRSDAARLYD
jgi:carboxypeptidase C (cathepsin A)